MCTKFKCLMIKLSFLTNYELQHGLRLECHLKFDANKKCKGNYDSFIVSGI